MVIENSSTNIAYRCPACGTLTVGFVGRFALSADMVRLRCHCGKSAADIKIGNDGKLRLSVPCIFCNQNHTYTVSQSIFFGRDLFLLNCPYSNMDICFIGRMEKIEKEAERTGTELERLMTDLGAEEIGDMQPQELAPSDILPDAQVYDIVRFTLRELEEEGNIDCPCHAGNGYDIRYTDGGVQIFCPHCGASHDIKAMTESQAEDFATVDRITLK